MLVQKFLGPLKAAGKDGGSAIKRIGTLRGMNRLLHDELIVNDQSRNEQNSSYYCSIRMERGLSPQYQAFNESFLWAVSAGDEGNTT